MNLKTIPLGVIGVTLAVAGAIAYSLAPEIPWLVALMEGSALLCLILFFVVHFISLKAFSTRRSTRFQPKPPRRVLCAIRPRFFSSRIPSWSFASSH